MQLLIVVMFPMDDTSQRKSHSPSAIKSLRQRRHSIKTGENLIENCSRDRRLTSVMVWEAVRA